VLGTALVLIAASLLSGGEAGAHGDLVWATGAMDARAGGAAQDIVEAWNQLHPSGPKVRIEALPDSPGDQRQQMAIELAAKSSEFDLLYLDVVWTGEFAERGWLADLEDIRARIKDVSLQGPVQSATWKGRLWAAPLTTDAAFLYYRTDLVDHPPKTWKELAEVGLRVGKEHGIAPFVGQGAPYEGMVVNYLEYLWGSGGDLFNSDGTKVQFGNDPSALTALEFMRNSLQSGLYAPGFNTMKEEDARNVFQSGNAVFMRNWPYAWALSQAPDSPTKGKVGVSALPKGGSDGKNTGTLGGWNWAVNKYSKNTKAAVDLAKYLTSPEEQKRAAIEVSFNPTIPALYKDKDILAKNPFIGELLSTFTNAVARPSRVTGSKYNQVSSEFWNAVHETLSGKSQAEESLAKLEKTLTRLSRNGKW